MSFTWAAGMITAPRDQPVLQKCLHQFFTAGFDDLLLFAEHGDYIVADPRLRIALRSPPRLGVWPNFYLACVELLQRNPAADAFLLLEDDALFYAGSEPSTRMYLEAICQHYLPELACLSLYATGSHPCKDPHIHGTNHGWCYSGAVALIFSRDALRHFVQDPRVVGHRLDSDGWAGTRLNDAVIGRWAAEDYQKPIGVHLPNLVQHIGETSTILNTPGRFSDTFFGIRPDHEQTWKNLVSTLTPELQNDSAELPQHDSRGAPGVAQEDP